MEKYKRQKPLAQEDIDSFKEQEFHKIKALVNDAKQERKIPILRYSMVSLFIILAAVSALIFFKQDQPIPTGPQLQINEIDAKSYVVELVQDDEALYFYYNAHVVHESDKIPYDDTFSYGDKYTYAPPALSETIDIHIDAFHIDDYRFYIQVNLEGDTQWIEIIVYNQHSSLKPINLTPTMPFEDTITSVHQLIDQYPPIYTGEDVYGRPQYTPNPDVTNTAEEGVVQAYNTYVENDYVDYTSYGERELKTTTILYDAIVVINDNAEVNYKTSHTHIIDGQVDSIALPDSISDSFAFYLRDGESISSKTSMFFDTETDQLDGRIVNFKHNLTRYAYTFIDTEESTVDLSQTTTVKYTYKLGYSLDPNQDVKEISKDVFFYQGDLIVPPVAMTPDSSDITSSLFSDLIISFYDEDDTLIYEIDMMPYN